MKKKFTKRLLSWVMAAAMVISMLPISAMATGTDGNVAKIGDTQYATLKAAIDNSEDGDVIELLADATLPTTSFPAGKSITIDGGVEKHTIDANQAYLNIAGTIVFQNCEMNMHGVPNGHWMYLYMASNGSLTFKNSTVTIDGTDAADNTTAMYFPEPGDPPADFAVENSTVVIKNCRGNGISWGGNTSPRRNTIKITDSNFTIDNCAEKNTAGGGGIIGTFDITITDSTVRVTNNKSYGSNGSNYYISGSTVEYSNNGTHGISATDLVVKNNSVVMADNNGYYGIYAKADFLVDGTSKMIVTKNSAEGDCAGLKLTGDVTDGRVEAGAVVTITDNYCSGLSNNGTCVFEEGVDLTIMDNDNSMGGDTGSHGGGIYNSGASANLTLPSDAVIYNNHALTDGDDIYNTGTIIFGKVDPTWVLDDCDHLIDGWYQDGANARWQVCDLAEGEEPHADEFVLENTTTTVTGLTALKAAHGLNPKDKTSYPGLDKQVSDKNEPDWTDGVNAAAGQDVNFKLTSNVPDDLLNYIIPDVDEPEVVEPVATNALVPVEDRGHYNLTFHDRMDEELDSNDDFTVFLDSNKNGVLDENDKELTYLDDYTISYNVNHDDGTCDFEIEMDLVDLYEKGAITDKDIENATDIIVTYTATLDKNAPAGEYKNTAWVTYESGSSSEVIVTVETYGLNIFKYDQATSSNEGGPTGLAGAEFTLTKDGDEDFSKTLTSGQDGTVSLEGLDAGTYYLKETKAPEGYVCSDKVVTIKIPDQTGTDNMVNVNFANSQIPHTGGMGTTLFSIVGGALIATAGVIFVISRKKRARSAA